MGRGVLRLRVCQALRNRTTRLPCAADGSLQKHTHSHTPAMASGYGMNGGRSRCFPFWQDYLACNAQSEKAGECALPLQDYMECLHHTKEVCDLCYMGE
ncbi:hypothetical protein G7K_2493-t2 [Saitoella complicata NRRL Y-17804]|uniref:NADH dehydrogenase [ubiquinone] iron-sulfur protein 5 n=2 Tax=Saitoella complicata (strain BCRC 22490 / CBS 7301 / JCM 7358 / NBRC 10748 / NRRL Y-17804) TaxID=698492 RepID=A0A0E9NEN3_SAICN|nr:hypothetical protein G7K_2493-t2 [Saitoella complicata NRRL Y-17804]